MDVPREGFGSGVPRLRIIVGESGNDGGCLPHMIVRAIGFDKTLNLM